MDGFSTTTRAIKLAFRVVLAWLGLTLCCQSQAQVTAMQPKVVVVAKENVPLQCGSGSVYYVVSTLKSGQKLRTDAMDATWYRVEYPAGLNAFVKAEDVEAEGGAGGAAVGGSVKLKQPARLQAAAAVSNERAYWWSLLDTPLDTGTVLKVNQVLTAGSEKRVYGYLVPAPAGSKGFVRREFVRDATPEEAAAFAPASAPVPASPDQPAPTSPDAQGTGTPPAPSDAGASPQPNTTTTTSGGADAGAAPSNPPATITMTDTPAVPTRTPEEIARDEEAARKAQEAIEAANRRAEERRARVVNLVATYDTVMKQPLNEAEVDPVVAEIERAISELGTEDAGARAATRSLSQRLEVLKVRQTLQTKRREIDEAEQAFKDRRAEIDRKVNEIQALRAYTVVGRLMPSSVYDGERLPKMFRVQSPDAGSARTLGYVAPTPSFDPLPYVGHVVGIVGPARLDESLRLNVVTPERVDILTALDNSKSE